MDLLWPFLVASLVSIGVRAEDARISPIPEAPGWQLGSLMHLQLTAPESEALQLTYDVYPLTESAGSNQTEALRSAIWIRGSLVSAGSLPNSERVQTADTIAFLSCDGENSTAAVNMLMAENPKAILLYSIDGNYCSLQGQDLSYSFIYSMGDAGEAQDTMNNTVQAGGMLRATITGSLNTTSIPGPQEQSGSNSAVAMSILYSITGLITLLFLVIIGSGAIRAHRYPARYGPRSSSGGQPRQSRAKGLARAVLETLPIVKFQNADPAKPDPALELESQPSGTPDPGMGTRLSAIPEEPQPQTRRSEPPPMSGAVSQSEVTATGQADAPAIVSADKAGPKADGRTSEDHLRCSICTEDFSVGEDVRVLPCDHKFHPPCIDPWLINVSGTCPLCRLDLRPQDQQPQEQHTGLIDPNDPFLFALPLAASPEWNEHHADEAEAPPSTTPSNTTTTNQRRRSSRLLDLHRLRHASVEERIEILRLHRSQQQQRELGLVGGGESEEQRGRRARLADRLLVRLRVRTRTLSPPPAPS